MKTIPLTRNLVALVDDEDFDRVNQFKWYAAKRGRTYYGVRTIRFPGGGGGKKEYLHQFILGIKGIDHRDGDGLDNQKQNLRKATQAQNLQGHQRKAEGATSQYRGVHWDANRKKWAAKVKTRGRIFHLGRHSSEIDAAHAYDSKAKELFGDFASPNFPCNKQPMKIQLPEDNE